MNKMIYLFQQCLEALMYIHEQTVPILHRDLKPDNLLLFNENSILKIGDFGVSRNLTNSTMSRNGTLKYMAPEVKKSMHIFYVDVCKTHNKCS